MNIHWTVFKFKCVGGMITHLRREKHFDQTMQQNEKQLSYGMKNRVKQGCILLMTSIHPQQTPFFFLLCKKKEKTAEFQTHIGQNIFQIIFCLVSNFFLLRTWFL